MSRGQDPELPAGGPAGDPADGDVPVATTRGDVHREGVPQWLAVVAGAAVVLVAWFAISRPSVDTRTTDDTVPPVQETAADGSATTGSAVTLGDPSASSTLVDDVTPESVASPPGPEAEDARPPDTDTLDTDVREPSAPLRDLAAEGWRLLVGDGQTIVDVDLGSGTQTRHPRIGAPLAIVGDRLLVDRDSRLVWLTPGDLDRPPEEIVEVPTLQRMLTRGRPADRPVVVDSGPDVAIWWPNNNADPQTWAKIRLADGEVLDSIALTDSVYGGPEVVATIGSGTFERVDGRWIPVGGLFASSASREAIVGQQCTQPDDCEWVLQLRGGTAPPERLSVPLGGPFDLQLVADAERILLRHSGGVIDHGTGRLTPVLGASGESVTAVNRAHLLALADSANIGLRSAVVTLVDLDGPADRSLSRILIDDLVPRWLVLVPPGP